jgi:hypothetical protein
MTVPINFKSEKNELDSVRSSGNLGSCGNVGSSSPPSRVISGDQALYLAMVACNKELDILGVAQTSVAQLSSALYNYMVPNSTNRLEDLQKDLDDDTWLQQNWSAFSKYFKSSGTMPPLGPGMSNGDLNKMKSFFNTYNTLTAARTAIGMIGQELNTQNTFVQEAKLIPDQYQDVQTRLEDGQTQIASMIADFLQVLKQMAMKPWH